MATAPARPAAKARTAWRIAPGEEARLTPEGPHDAVISSRGTLPLRVRTEAGGVHHRPPFPGTTVNLGGRHYEVVGEIQGEEDVEYLLDAWPHDNIVRDQVAYGPALVRAVQAERRRLEERERARTWSWLLYPLVGLLPEERQRLDCDRYGLDPHLATKVSAVFETAFFIFALSRLMQSSAEGFGFAIAGSMAFIFPAIMRFLGSLIARDVTGSAVVTAALMLLGRLTPEGRDVTVLPLTRRAFWERLHLPDKQRREPDGRWVVESVLPHLTWDGRHRLEAEGTWWLPVPLPPTVERGKLVHRYRLEPVEEGAAADAPPPDPRRYQDEVLAAIQGHWEEMTTSSLALVVSLLPADVQERAFSTRGPRAAARASQVTAGLTLAAAVWFLLGRDVFSVLTALVLGYDGVRRLLWVKEGRYAPSLFGSPFGELFAPDRAEYQRHLEAEGRALDEARRATPR